MKIKHWQGYGCVAATKLKKTQVVEDHEIYCIVIKVSGNHECGLVREGDNYTIKKWLLDRFEKGIDVDTRDIKYDVIDVGIENGTEFAVYSIWYGRELRNIM